MDVEDDEGMQYIREHYEEEGGAEDETDEEDEADGGYTTPG
jgi:hypothetical protein